MKNHINLHVASRKKSMAHILHTAAAVFARRGFEGATTGEIAEKAGVAKATIHYYFETKEGLYTSVLDQVLSDWAAAMSEIDVASGPMQALSRYIRWKIDYSRREPDLTRVWAMEVISGAPHVQTFLHEKVRRLVEQKGQVVKSWIADEKMDPIDPAHLFFMLWALTQTYAECEAQITVVLNKDALDEDDFQTANTVISRVLLKGLGITSAA